MPRLRELIPDAETLVRMDPTELAGFVLEVLLTLPRDERGNWHRRNFCMSAGHDYGVRNVGPDTRVSEACAVAWSWLEANWLICRHPEQGDDWYMPTKKGKDVRDRTGVRQLIDRSQLPEHFLHSAFLADVLPLFLQGRYDLAVFEGFHRLEIAIREAASLPDDLLGTKLASKAFHPEDGPLTDKNAELGERHALMNLMCGALGSYKNPQSHRHVGLDAPEAREMILIASHLMKIVDSRK
jgi:uncharacterized protein (TIGR02391 family)